MPVIQAFQGRMPQTPDFLAENACLVGDVSFGIGCSVWFGAILRGDLNPIVLGDRVNVQDGSIVHVSHDHGCRIGSDSSIGHRVVVHACTVGAHCLLGNGSVVLDGAVIGDWCIVAAGAVVGEGTFIPAGSLVAGLPARVVKPLEERHRERIRHAAATYGELLACYALSSSSPH